MVGGVDDSDVYVGVAEHLFGFSWGEDSDVFNVWGRNGVGLDDYIDAGECECGVVVGEYDALTCGWWVVGVSAQDPWREVLFDSKLGGDLAVGDDIEPLASGFLV